jgi:hypothetical protein
MVFYCFICCHTLTQSIDSCRILLVIISIITGTYSCQKLSLPIYKAMYNVLYVRTYEYWGGIFGDLLNLLVAKMQKREKESSITFSLELRFNLYVGNVGESPSLPYFCAFVSSFPPCSIKLL